MLYIDRLTHTHIYTIFYITWAITLRKEHIMTDLIDLPFIVVILTIFLTMFLFLFNIYTLYNWFALIEEYELLDEKLEDLEDATWNHTRYRRY